MLVSDPGTWGRDALRQVRAQFNDESDPGAWGRGALGQVRAQFNDESDPGAWGRDALRQVRAQFNDASDPGQACPPRRPSAGRTLARPGRSWAAAASSGAEHVFVALARAKSDAVDREA
jgi:hypothetical protein